MVVGSNVIVGVYRVDNLIINVRMHWFYIAKELGKYLPLYVFTKGVFFVFILTCKANDYRYYFNG
jgi:hypothetical protein